MKHIPVSRTTTMWTIGSIIGLLLIGCIYSIIRIQSLAHQVGSLQSDLTTLASTTISLQATVSQTYTALSVEQQNSVNAIRQELGGFQNQVGNLSGSLTTLQKLSKTDPELLKKYSKVYFLNENYVPARLAQIPQTHQYSNNKQMLIHADVLPKLISMIDTASSTGVQLYVASAYRSFAEQRALKSNYRVTYGAGTANTFSADQGYSEHQLGTAIDMTSIGLGGGLEGFDRTPAYTWMQQNAHKYGFILSYPKGNAAYIFEPWHWRYVGVKLATELHNQGKTFYDLDQRTIDTYLVSIFD